MTCERCGKETHIFVMSYFNTESICMECRDLEEGHPAFEHARRVEHKHVAAGDYNFVGIGLPDGYDDWARRVRSER